MTSVKMNFFLVACVLFAVAVMESEATGHCFYKSSGNHVSIDKCTDFYKAVTGHDGNGDGYCACCPEDQNSYNGNCGPKTHHGSGHFRNK